MHGSDDGRQTGTCNQALLFACTFEVFRIIRDLRTKGS